MARKRRRILKATLYLLLILLLVLAGVGIFSIVKLRASLPIRDGELQIQGLNLPVTVTSDRFGIPTITAATQRDAALALGYVTAQDRLFQMDLLRRRAAGRLSEIVGKIAIKSDKRLRVIGFNRVTQTIVANLPDEQREILVAYADGVNAFIQQMDTPPFEFLLLGYRPEPWTVGDSILVVMNMFQSLALRENDERMMTIMEKALPPEVVAFFTPDTDSYAQPLLGGPDSHRPMQPIPVEALASIRRAPKKSGERLVRATHYVVGSNGWTVGPSRTADGRAIVANDMHLGLSIPNTWYRAALRYENVEISGVILPGTPAVVVGSNSHVAWGFTYIAGDFLDLVRLEIHPENPEEYKTPEGWKQFEVINERIEIRGGKHIVQPVKLTIWGPVSQTPLMGQPVAIRWTALQPEAVGMELLDMDKAKTVEDAIYIMNRFRNVPLNVVMADSAGQIAWTYCGKIPIRKGFDGSSAKSWAHGDIGWEGYIPPSELPRVISPPAGFIASANDRALGKDYPYIIGYNFANGHRAYRINERLREMDQITEEDMFQLQLDTMIHFYKFYQQLALSILTEEVIANKPLLLEAQKQIAAWNGKAEVDSVAFGILVSFRDVLAEDVLEPFLVLCHETDRKFLYAWRNTEPPLRTLLREKIAEVLPDPVNYPNWEAFILAKLEKSIEQLLSEHNFDSLNELTWGSIHTTQISHPLGFIPILGKILNMPQDPLPGDGLCVRSPYASERMVISPGHEADGILQIPCGQSGHPLSKNYRDQYSYWLKGEPLPFLQGPTTHTLTLNPAP